MAGEALHARLPIPSGTTYYVDGKVGDPLNGGTSLALRSNAADGQTFGGSDLRLNSAAALFVPGDVGHGIMIDVGGVANFRKITLYNSPTSVNYSGAAIAAGSGRTWRLGGMWKIDQNFFDRALVGSTSPAPGDICEVREWFTTLVGAITNVATSITVAGNGAALGFPTSGTLFTLQLESEADYARGYKGVTDGTTSVLLDADNHFPTDGSVVGKQIWIQNQFSAVNATGTATLNGTNTITAVTPTTGWVNGMTIIGTGIPANTTIVSGAGTASMVLSAVTGTGTGVAITGLAGTWEKRTVSSVTSAGNLTYSGAAIVARTLACWRIINVEDVLCTAWADAAGNCTLTVTRGTQGSMASAHADAVRVDIPYLGTRATSLSDTGGGHVINSQGTALLPYMMQNFSGHAVYFHGAADVTSDPTRCEVLRYRTPSQYWIVRKNPAGGSFTIERARDAGGGSNSSNIYFANNLDGEAEGLRCRWAQRGTGFFSDVTCSRTHKYALESYYNDIDLSFNHHGGYEEGDNSDTINCIFRDHAFGNGLQVRSGAISSIIAHNTAVRNRDGGTGNEYAGFWHEGTNSGCQFRNNVSQENRNGFRGSAVSTGTNNTAFKNLTFNNRVGNFTNQSANASLYSWDATGTNFSTTGAGADDTVADAKFVDANALNFRIQAASPAYGYGEDAYRPPKDFEGNLRSSPTAGALRAFEEIPVAGGTQPERVGSHRSINEPSTLSAGSRR